MRDARFRVQLQLVDRARPLMERLARRTGERVVAAYCDGHELTLLASVGRPNDLRAASAVIGEQLPVTAPIGIWWMAFAAPAHVQTWLQDLESEGLRDSYRQALEQIRQRGYCLGLKTVHTAAQGLLGSRPAAGGEPTHQERQLIGGLALDPLDYVPPQNGRATPDRTRLDVVSLWAPTFTPDGDVALGLMLTGNPDDERPPAAHAEDLLELARDVTALAAA